jgi:hypothetical protein
MLVKSACDDNAEAKKQQEAEGGICSRYLLYAREIILRSCWYFSLTNNCVGGVELREGGRVEEKSGEEGGGEKGGERNTISTYTFLSSRPQHVMTERFFFLTG